MSESDQSGDKRNGAVGYGRPPVNRQFKPGQSGNPRGRPKGSKNFVTVAAEALSRPVKVRENGKIRTLTKWEAIIEGTVNQAVAGDPKARATILQLADKLEAYNRLTVNYKEHANSALEHLQRRLAEIRPPAEQETTPQKESQDGTPAQHNPNIN
jgi:hypothetical protein